MSDPRQRRVAELFHAALEHSGEHRERFLRTACDDDGLRAEVRELLAAHELNHDFLEDSPHQRAAELIDRQLADRLIGRRFGQWRIEHLIHSGGMGSVYLARRSGDQFEQRGALKLIRAGLNEAHLREAFARERRLLATLEHPGIARLLDGGTTEDGVPWLVMEYVDGVPIDRWADDQQLDTGQRLALFEQLCAAVEHAHQHLVVHRDIKPGNVLVTADGTPRLLDFGIARLLPETSLDIDMTLTRQRMLTPACASPEQIMGQPVTTASDVYQLGVLLYRLLTRTLPLDVTTTSAAEAERLICTQTPPLPSSRVERTLARRLRGDLDAIIMTTLRKEPARRYGSALALAEDLRRFRNGQPVQARPDSIPYRTGKFLRRHWQGVALTSMAFLALMAGLAVAVWQAEAARSERDRLQHVNEFMESILLEADPSHAGTDATVRDMLATAGQRIEHSFQDSPQIEASIRHTIGYAQLSLMLLDEAEHNLLRASELNHRLYGPHDVRSLRSRAYLAWLDYSRGQYDQAAADYAAIIAQLTSRHPPGFRATVINDSGLVLAALEQHEQALARFEQALALHLEHEPDHADLPLIYNNIGFAWHNLGDLVQAEAHYRQALEHLRHQHADNPHPDIAYGLNNVGLLLRDLGRHEEALPLFLESLEIRTATLGEQHPGTGHGHLNLARLLLEMQRPESARPHARRAWENARDQLEPEQLQYMVARLTWARIQYFSGQTDQAVAELKSSYESLVAANASEYYVDQARRWLEEAVTPVQHGASLTEPEQSAAALSFPASRK